MEEIYIKYSPLIYHYLYGLTNDRELSEELMQETFYSALKNIHQFKGKSKISTWLYKIAKNKWKDYLRNNHDRASVSLDESDMIAQLIVREDFSEQVDLKDNINLLYEYISKLDENVREIFYLRINANLSFKEISKLIGKTEEWTRVTFYRNKIKIKEEVLNYEK